MEKIVCGKNLELSDKLTKLELEDHKTIKNAGKQATKADGVADAAKLNKATKAADAGIDTLNDATAVTTVDPSAINNIKPDIPSTTKVKPVNPDVQFV